jgi:hypothetical protein
LGDGLSILSQQTEGSRIGESNESLGAQQDRPHRQPIDDSAEPIFFPLSLCEHPAEGKRKQG